MAVSLTVPPVGLPRGLPGVARGGAGRQEGACLITEPPLNLWKQVVFYFALLESTSITSDFDFSSGERKNFRVLLSKGLNVRA